jgi:hypothetical protein
VSIDEIVEREVLGEAGRACDQLIERVRGRVVGEAPQTAVELSVYAAAALEAYYDTLLRALIAAASRRAGTDVEVWVRRQFHAGLDRAGTALREAVSESPHRHAVAQKLQQKMFEGEVSLRRALSTRFAEAATALGSTAIDDVAVLMHQRKAAG